MRTLLVLLSVLVATSLALADSPAPSTQPATAPTSQPRVFRCVLDGNPRMLVIDFRNGVMAAFDTQKCELVKVWRGDVEFTGTVYDTKHGPQPRSRGEVLPCSMPYVPQGSWAGYAFQENSVLLRKRDYAGQFMQLRVKLRSVPAPDQQRLNPRIDLHDSPLDFFWEHAEGVNSPAFVEEGNFLVPFDGSPSPATAPTKP